MGAGFTKKEASMEAAQNTMNFIKLNNGIPPKIQKMKQQHAYHNNDEPQQKLTIETRD